MKRAALADPRRLAWDVLVAVENGAFADAELGRRLPRTRLDPRDSALATRLVYGTLAWQGYLDHVVAAFDSGARSLDVPIRVLLRLALFQLAKLSRVPDFAAVDTAVTLSKTFRGGAASKLVNAVLRRYLREKDTIFFPSPAEDPAGWLSVSHSHPRWLVDLWLEQLGRAETELLLAANNEAAPTVLRVNRRRAARPDVLHSLHEAGIAARPATFAPDAIVLDEGADPASLPGYAEGRFSVQGEASQLIPILLGTGSGARVLDACAAPGGKAAQIAEQIDDRGSVLAVDVNRHGLARLSGESRRLRLHCIRIVQGDARELARSSEETFDAVLLDAPCSGLGTLRQHPEIRWRRSTNDLQQAAALQADLLRCVAERVRPGGVLVYATCTIDRVENEDVVGRFLADTPDFVLEDPAPLLPLPARELVEASHFVRTFPHRHALDGFFAARLKRRD